MKLLAEYSDASAAEIVKGMLEAQGLSAYVDAPIMASLYGAGLTWAPVKLFVNDDDYESAITLMKTHSDI